MAEKEGQSQELPQGNLPSATHEGNVDLPGKSTWPELVGLTSEEAEKKIKDENPAVTRVQVVPPDSFLTMEFRTDRVRIFVDSSGKVVKPPTVG